MIQLESPSQNERLSNQKKKRAAGLTKAIQEFDPLNVHASLVRIARASRYDDKKDLVPKRGGKKRRANTEGTDLDDGGGDATIVNPRAMDTMRI